MELYSERGYEQTTVAEIAKRAGVTERTFFRHFTDKREVLFSGSDVLRERMLAGLDAVGPSAPVLDAVRAAIESLCDVFTEREFSRRRQAIIAANPELRERELIKLAAYTADLAEALRRRGTADPAARLAAEMGLAAFHVAWERWLGASDERSMRDFAAEAFDAMKSLSAPRA